MSHSTAPRGRTASLLLAVLTLAGAGLYAVHARAESGTATPAAGGDSLWTRDKLFGDMGGLRSALGKRGVRLDLRLSQYYQNVVDGGVDTGGAYGALMDYIVNVDGEKLGLWKGLFLNLKAQTQFGGFDSFVGKPGTFALTNSQLLYPA